MESNPADAPMRDSDGEPSWGPVVVCECISSDDFVDWLDKNEGVLRRWEYEPLSDTTGRVVIYCLPTLVHERPAGNIVDSVCEQVQRIGNDFDLIDTLESHASPRLHTGDRNQEPDQSLKPAGARAGTFPNLIVEIAYFNGSWDELNRWMDPSTTVQVAIGVKIFTSIRRRAILLRRNGPAQEVEFGEDVESPEPLSFPLRCLYNGAMLPLALVGHEDDPITIDLVALRETIQAAFA